MLEGVKTFSLAIGQPGVSVAVEIGEKRVGERFLSAGFYRQHFIIVLNKRGNLAVLTLCLWEEMLLVCALPDVSIQILQPDGSLLVFQYHGNTLGIAYLFAMAIEIVTIDTICLTSIKTSVNDHDRCGIGCGQMGDTCRTDLKDSIGCRSQQTAVVLDELPAG